MDVIAEFAVAVVLPVAWSSVNGVKLYSETLLAIERPWSIEFDVHLYLSGVECLVLHHDVPVREDGKGKAARHFGRPVRRPPARSRPEWSPTGERPG